MNTPEKILKLKNGMQSFFNWVPIITISLTLLSAWFLVKGQFSMSPETIAKCSISTWDWNDIELKSLCSQKANTVVGFFLLIASSLLQSVYLGYSDKTSLADYKKTLKPLLIFVIIVSLITAIFSITLQQRFYNQSKQIINQLLK